MSKHAIVLSLGALLVVLAGGTAALAAAAPAKKAKRPASPVFRPIEDTPGLPRALLIGDSISIGYTLPTRKLLEGKVNLHRAPTNCGPTTRGLQQLDAWLGEGKWDVIHFNFGLHDLKYINEKGGRVAPDAGKIQVPIDQYEKNLDTLVKRLKETGAKLIWAATTPVPEGASGRIPGDSARYNAVAKKVMASRGVATNDLYAFTKPRLKDIQRPRDVHFTREGSEALAKQVAASILKALQGK